jgi:hypothetical protein
MLVTSAGRFLRSEEVSAPLRPLLQSKTGKNNIFPVFDQKQRSETELLARRNLPALITSKMFYPCTLEEILLKINLG